MKNKRSLAYIIAIIVAVIVAVVTSVNTMNTETEDDTTAKTIAPANDNKLVVHFIDVGQGDSEFIELPNGECMLIDAGESFAGDRVVEAIESLGYNKIDYLVATHPHTDHIGGMSDVVEKFEIGQIYMPKATSNSKTFENLLLAISDKNMKINTASAGKVILTDDTLEIKLVAPVGTSYKDLNNYSAVVRITYGKNSFIFMGDAENIAEREILEAGDIVDSDVIKVGHHGSRYSSTIEFLSRVTPKYAVIECGNGNKYGHPHDEAMERLKATGAEIYRTDVNGNIVISCDGNDGFEVDTNEVDS